MSQLTELRKQAASCTSCELHTDATQTVFGAGQPGASIVLAGEQPGDQEDRQGKRRIHQTPGIERVRACLPWLRAELHAVEPKLLVTLGATAAKSLLGSSFRLTHHRGELLEFAGLPLVATIHPSVVLRTPDERRDEMFNGLVADLELAGRTAASSRVCQAQPEV